MSLCVTLIQGGEIGHDLVPAVKRVIAAAGVAIEWDEHLAGYEAIKHGQGCAAEADARVSPKKRPRRSRRS